MRCHVLTVPFLAASLLSLTGCGSSDDETTSTTTTDEQGNGDPTGSDPNGSETTTINPDDYEPGLVPCEPFDSGFEGDELCVQPIDPSEGAYMHVGPDDYDDPDQIDEFIMGPGEESTECYYFGIENERMLFFGQKYRLRPGTHHLIMQSNLGIGAPSDFVQAPDGWGDCEMDGYFPVGGTQRSISTFPVDGITAPEDEGLGRPLKENAPMMWELHYVNSKEEPILREGWVNVNRVPWDENARVLGNLFLIGAIGMDLPPGQTEIYNQSCEMAADERRVVSIYGHRHANAPRFSVWHNHDGQRDLVYEDYDWNEPAELHYNSIVQNPEPNEELGQAGGFSGILNIVQGDTLEWECEVVNNRDINLTIGNQTYDAEMCNLFGLYTGAVWIGRGGPDDE